MIISTSARVDIDVDVDIDLDDLDFEELFDYVRTKSLGRHIPENLDNCSYKVELAIRELASLKGEKENLIWLIENITGKIVW